MAILSNKMLNLKFACLIICAQPAFSQENSIYENYYISPFLINPAAAGANYYKSGEFSVRKQWLGFTDAPVTFLMAFNSRLGSFDFYDPKGFVNKGPLKLNDRVGLGAAIYRDVNGPLSNTGGLLSYAYHLPLGADSRLAFGLSVLGTYYAFNDALLRPDQADDPYLMSGNDDIFRINFNLGVYFHNPTYFVGLSANKILPDIQWVNNETKAQPSIFLTGGYKFFKDYKSFIFEPSITCKLIAFKDPSMDIHTKLYIKRVNWIALSYSTVGKADFRFAFRLFRMFGVGYNYEFSTGGIAPYNYGSHEFMLGFNLGLTEIEGIRTSRDY